MQVHTLVDAEIPLLLPTQLMNVSRYFDSGLYFFQAPEETSVFPVLLFSNIAKLWPHRCIWILGTALALFFYVSICSPKFKEGVHQNEHVSLIPGYVMSMLTFYIVFQ